MGVVRAVEQGSSGKWREEAEMQCQCTHCGATFESGDFPLSLCDDCWDERDEDGEDEEFPACPHGLRAEECPFC